MLSLGVNNKGAFPVNIMSLLVAWAATAESLVFPLCSFCQIFNVLPVSATYALLQSW